MTTVSVAAGRTGRPSKSIPHSVTQAARARNGRAGFPYLVGVELRGFEPLTFSLRRLLLRGLSEFASV